MVGGGQGVENFETSEGKKGGGGGGVKILIPLIVEYRYFVESPISFSSFFFRLQDLSLKFNFICLTKY